MRRTADELRQCFITEETKFRSAKERSWRPQGGGGEVRTKVVKAGKRSVGWMERGKSKALSERGKVKFSGAGEEGQKENVLNGALVLPRSICL